MVEHVNIPNAHIHEPKGVSTAPAGSVYVANGLGSGSWTVPQVIRMQAGITGNTNVTDVGVGDEWVKVNVGTDFLVNNSNSLFMTGITSGTINYQHSATRGVLACASIRVVPSTTDPATYLFAFTVNGTPVQYADTKVTVDGGFTESASLNTMLVLAQGDQIELWCNAVGHTLDVTVESISISILGVA